MKAAVLGSVLAGSAAGAFTPVWVTGAGRWAACGATTTVFNVTLCLSPAAAAASYATKANHVANVVAQLLDNDADGTVDASTVVDKMVSDDFFLVVPASDADNQTFQSPNIGVGQMSHLGEAIPNSCDTPTNRGATTDRSSWAAAKDTQTGCDPARDATTEEVLHLITEAAAQIWPAKWGGSYTSTSGQLIQATNGNCGNGYSSNYIDPSTTGCVGQFAYNDATCDERCLVVEGIYWAIASYTGGLYTTARAQSVQNEWLMTTPDASSMPVIPSGVANARSLQTGAPALYALVSDTTSTENTWIPSIFPNGNYVGPASAPASVLVGGDGGGASAPASGGDGGGDSTVGIAVGAACGGVAVLAVVGFFVRRRRMTVQKLAAPGVA